MATAEHHLIGRWHFEVADGVLRGGSGDRPLEDRAARTLAALCRRRGEIIGRDELLAEIWHGRAVSPNSVAVVIGDLRRALDDDARNPTHIVTIAKRGYRLNATPVVVPDAQPPKRHAWSGHAGPWLAVSGMGALLALVLVLLPAPSGRWRQLVVEPVGNETGLAGDQPLACALSTVVIDRASRFGAVRLIASDTVPAASAKTRRLRIVSRLIL